MNMVRMAFIYLRYDILFCENSDKRLDLFIQIEEDL